MYVIFIFDLFGHFDRPKHVGMGLGHSFLEIFVFRTVEGQTIFVFMV